MGSHVLPYFCKKINEGYFVKKNSTSTIFTLICAFFVSRDGYYLRYSIFFRIVTWTLTKRSVFFWTNHAISVFISHSICSRVERSMHHNSHLERPLEQLLSALGDLRLTKTLWFVWCIPGRLAKSANRHESYPCPFPFWKAPFEFHWHTRTKWLVQHSTVSYPQIHFSECLPFRSPYWMSRWDWEAMLVTFLNYISEHCCTTRF
jgi:hypothetical protein